MEDERHEPKWPPRRAGAETKDQILFGRIKHHARNGERSLALTELIATLRDPNTKLAKPIPEIVSIIVRNIREVKTPQADALADSIEWPGKKAKDKEQLISILEDLKHTQDIFLGIEARRNKRTP